VALIGAGKFRIGRHADERFECAFQGFLEHARDPEAASPQRAQPTRSGRGRSDGTMQ
jgi:hypothetical protein